MKHLLCPITCLCVLFVGIQAQVVPDISVGVVQLRALLGIADNVTLVQTATSSGSRLAFHTNETFASSNLAVRFELRSNSWPVYDGGVTAEFYLNGTYASLWTSRAAEIIVHDKGLPRVSSRRALYILARRFNLCPQIKDFQNKDISLYYLMNPYTKVGRLIYRASAVYYGQVTSLGNETTETVRPTALIDAVTGEVIESWNGFTAQAVTTTKIRAFGGNVGDVLQKTTYPELVVGLQADGRCIYSTPDVQVQSMVSSTTGQFSPTVFACTAPASESYDNANGGFSPLNDAMNNAQTTVNMYRTYVNNIDSPPFNLPVKLRVHFGVNYANAFWDGTYANFGDGSSTTFYPLVTLDNVAHELGHAFTGYPTGSNLETLGEAGGINEAFSDMSGQAAIFYSGREATMKPGSEFTKTGTELRDMCNPPSDGASIDKYSDYKGDMDPHYSSGLYNKVFCILSKLGGVWNVRSAFRVFAYANRLTWRPKTSFNDGVCNVQSAASYVLGPDSVRAVSDAFRQVGLSCAR